MDKCANCGQELEYNEKYKCYMCPSCRPSYYFRTKKFLITVIICGVLYLVLLIIQLKSTNPSTIMGLQIFNYIVLIVTNVLIILTIINLCFYKYTLKHIEPLKYELDILHKKIKSQDLEISKLRNIIEKENF